MSHNRAEYFGLELALFSVCQVVYVFLNEEGKTLLLADFFPVVFSYLSIQAHMYYKFEKQWTEKFSSKSVLWQNI